jgi:V-type H+-transporting ATPase proteolipid subunit
MFIIEAAKTCLVTRYCFLTFLLLLILLIVVWLQMAAGLCCGLSCLAAGGTIGLIGDCSVRCVGIKAERGRRWWQAGGGDGGGDDVGARDNYSTEASNKLYVGMLIMLIFSEALAL